MLLRARIVLPISRPPIMNGGLVISGDRIAQVGRWSELKATWRGAEVDLGEVILMPGLVNAHCHLDYTNMAGKIVPTKHFPDWIKGMLALKANWSYSEYAQSWLAGANALLNSGTTTVADIEAVPELLPDAWSGTPLRVLSLLEITGVRSGRPAAEIVEEALEKIETCQSATHPVGLSPHAPYSTRPELLQLAACEALKRNLLVATHVAESREEFEMYLYRRGPLFDWLKSQRDMTDCDGLSPVQQVARAGLLRADFLAVHVNHIAPGDAELLALNGASVVHCPRSHSYFRHDRFPLEEFKRAGVNVCLGTDSSASILHTSREPAQLNMFSELQEFQKAHPATAPRDLLVMATVNGAKALRMTGITGEFCVGAKADLITLPFGGDMADAEYAAVNCRGQVSGVMIDGRWAVSPGTN